jgi:hypothetical protein
MNKVIYLIALILAILPLSASALSPTPETAKCMSTPPELRSEECKQDVKNFAETTRKWNAENGQYNKEAIWNLALIAGALILIIGTSVHFIRKAKNRITKHHP